MRLRLPRSLNAAAVTVMTAAVVTACGSAETPAATQVARRFTEAVDAHQGAAACSYLAPATKSELEQSAGKPCSAALVEEGLQDAGAFRSATAYGTMAQIKLREDTLFLSRFQGGWKVMAAGCSPRAERPYDCELQGG
jgi:hypothetical protein